MSISDLIAHQEISEIVIIIRNVVEVRSSTIELFLQILCLIIAR